jgi:tetratricopeptide (TPR) repeat protein
MNKNLVQAREYLESAAAQRPDDAHIIDSVGWAYYLAGDFQTAVAKFEQAVEMLPDDATVNEHLGDAYWRVGRETEARFQWERALTFKPEQEVAEQLREKLASGMPAFVPSPEMSAKKPQATAAGSMPRTQVQ